MKKKLKILTIVIILLIIIKIIFSLFSKGHEKKYLLKIGKNKFKIEEILIRNQKNEKNTYNIKIKKENTVFSYQIDNVFKNKKKIIKNIKYYKDKKYECLLPIFKDKKVLTDVICKIGDNYYNYHDITNQGVTKFVNSIKEYNTSNFKEKSLKKYSKNNTIIYKSINSIDDKIIIDNYKGIYVIDKKEVKNIKLFKKDIYKKYIKGLNDKYYLIADYDDKYEFSKLYLVNIKNGNKELIISNYDISFDSYVQGNYKDKIYLFDKNNKTQYVIDISKKEITKNTDTDNNIDIYNLNNWEKATIYDASKKEIKFNYYEQKDSKGYYKIDKVGGEKTGYYYYYLKRYNKYEIYRSSVLNKNQKLYLFTLNDISRIVYKNDKIYYIDDNYIKIYQDKFGIKKLVKNNELNFNKNLAFYIY